MFGAFGGITFQLLGGPEKLETEDKTQYGKLDVFGAPPVLQWIYDDLTTLDFGIRFHQFWCDPTSAIAAFQQIRLQHQPQPLVFGDDNRGNFVITSIRQIDAWRADDGTLIDARCQIRMMQWAGALPQSAPTLPTQPDAVGTTTAGDGATALQAPSVAGPSISVSAITAMSGTITGQVSGTVDVAGYGSLTLTGSAAATMSGNLPGTAIGSVTGLMSGSLSGSVSGTLSGFGAVMGTISGEVSAGITATVAATGVASANISAAVSGTVSIPGFGSISGSLTGNLSGTASGSLSGSFAQEPLSLITRVQVQL